MIGAGTGIAPFIAAIDELEKLKEINPEFQMPEVWMLFGCRKRDEDFLYRDKLKQFFTPDQPTRRLITAFSREGPPVTVSGYPRRVYVQHLLRTDPLLRSVVSRAALQASGKFDSAPIKEKHVILISGGTPVCKAVFEAVESIAESVMEFDSNNNPPNAGKFLLSSGVVIMENYG
jgi:hypothetical protein